MARNGSGVYELPAGTVATPSTTIESAKYNTFIADIAADQNVARPVTAGGTGGTTVAQAITALGLDAALALGGAATQGSKLSVRSTVSGYASSTIYKTADIAQTVTPTSDSDQTEATFTDYCAHHIYSEVPIGETNVVGKQRAGANYAYNYGTGGGRYAWGSTSEYWNERNADVLNGSGGLFISSLNYSSHGSTGRIRASSGLTAYSRNYRNSGQGMDFSYGAQFFADNYEAGTVGFGVGVYAAVRNTLYSSTLGGTGIITFAVGVESVIKNEANAGTITTAIGIRSAADEGGGIITNYYHYWMKAEIGSIGGNWYGIYGETLAPSYLAGNLYLGYLGGSGGGGLDHSLEIVNSGFRFLRMGDVITNATIKYGIIDVRPYTNSEEDTMVIGASSDAAANIIYIGGGFSSRNAATAVNFYTASAVNTVTGTSRMSIGLGVGVGASDPGAGKVNALNAYQVNGTQVVGARSTGWAAMTGSANVGSVYDTATVTLAQLAGRVMSLQAMVTAHGLAGA